jgi:Peptidase M16 inactive domain
MTGPPTVTGTPPVRRRELHHRRVPALGWDLAEGDAGEPAAVAGRAALAARYLADALARDPSAAGWIRRHRLTRHASQFSFWAPDLGIGPLTEAVSRIDLDPPAGVLTPLVAGQLAQARMRRENPLALMFRAASAAAWGDPVDEALGDQQTLTSACDAGLGDYLTGWADGAQVIKPATTADRPDRSPAGQPIRSCLDQPWRGETVLVDRPGDQCRLVLSSLLADRVDDEVCATVLAQALDGTDGLLFRWLRTEAGLVYGTVALAKDDEGRRCTLTIGASLLRDRLPAVVDVIRRCVDRIRTGELPAEALGRAAVRVVNQVLTRLDEPFGALDDYRRLLAGQRSQTVVADGALMAARKLRDGPRLSEADQPGIGYVGAVDETVPRLLGRLR